jgi:hypothetical protein
MSSKWETQDTETDEQTKERRHIVSDTVHQSEELAQNWTAAKLRGNIIFLGNALTDGFVGIGPRGQVLVVEREAGPL